MTQMSCNEFVELVTAFLDGALEPAAEARFIEHIAACDGCDRYLDQIRQTIRELGELPSGSLSDEAQDRLLTAFRTWQP